jgi:hypothetical protein
MTQHIHAKTCGWIASIKQEIVAIILKSNTYREIGFQRPKLLQQDWHSPIQDCND